MAAAGGSELDFSHEEEGTGNDKLKGAERSQRDQGCIVQAKGGCCPDVDGTGLARGPGASTGGPLGRAIGVIELRGPSRCTAEIAGEVLGLDPLNVILK